MNIKKRSFRKSLISNNSGFSLVEILIALTLMGIGGAFVMSKLSGSLHEGRVKAAKIQMHNFSSMLKDFKRKCHFYPTTEQGLDSLLQKPSGRECKNYPPGGFMDAESLPLDPWDNDFMYESDGKKFNIVSYGGDQTEGGEEEDADVYLNPPKN